MSTNLTPLEQQLVTAYEARLTALENSLAQLLTQEESSSDSAQNALKMLSDRLSGLESQISTLDLLLNKLSEDLRRDTTEHVNSLRIYSSGLVEMREVRREYQALASQLQSFKSLLPS